jgi:hypothetical protein
MLLSSQTANKGFWKHPCLPRSRGSSVGIAIVSRTGRHRRSSSSPGRVKNFVPSTVSRSARCPVQPAYTWNIEHTQKNGAVPKVDRKFISYPERALTAAEAVQISFSCATRSSIIMLTAGPRDRKDAPHKNNDFVKPCTNLTLHCNHRSGHLKTEQRERLLLLRRHLGNCSRGPAVSMRGELLVAHEKLGQFRLLILYGVPV